jgi:hypothetical protein
MTASSSWDTIQTVTLVVNNVLYAFSLMTMGMSLRILLLRKEQFAFRSRRDIKWKVLACNVIFFLLATTSLVISCVYRMGVNTPGIAASWQFDWASVGATSLLRLSFKLYVG